MGSLRPPRMWKKIAQFFDRVCVCESFCFLGLLSPESSCGGIHELNMQKLFKVWVRLGVEYESCMKMLQC